MDLSEVPGTSFRRHPWEVARAEFMHAVLRDAGLLGARRNVLDVGAGDGYLARQLVPGLPEGSRWVCFDLHYTDAELARFGHPREPGLTFTRHPPTGRFGLLLLLDVIEHVVDDRAFLRGLIRDNLEPGAAVLISVPAWQALYTRHDESLKHHRRYSPAGARALLTDVGLEVSRSGGLFHSLLAPRMAMAAAEKLLRFMGVKPRAPSNLGGWRAGPAISAAVEAALAVDAAIGRRAAAAGLTLPGLSFWALAHVGGVAT
jgi:2-polyprenyl-3-methyl-5-hydroxy-6-metoxy-1,4-benzoquinol methylase